MIRRLLITAALLAPTALFAQRGGRTQADKKTALFDKQEMPKGVDMRVRDLEDQSPLHLLIEKRKDLKLTDAQVAKLKDADGKLTEKNALVYKAADSLIKATRLTSDASDEAKSRAMTARRTLPDVIQTMTENYDAAAKDVVALLEGDQVSKAKEMLDKQKADAEKFNREHIGGRS